MCKRTYDDIGHCECRLGREMGCRRLNEADGSMRLRARFCRLKTGRIACRVDRRLEGIDTGRDWKVAKGQTRIWRSKVSLGFSEFYLRRGAGPQNVARGKGFRGVVFPRTARRGLRRSDETVRAPAVSKYRAFPRVNAMGAPFFAIRRRQFVGRIARHGMAGGGGWRCDSRGSGGGPARGT